MDSGRKRGSASSSFNDVEGRIMAKNGEFMGATREHLKNIDKSMCRIEKKIDSFDKRWWAILILLSVTVIERFPDIVKFAFAK